MGEHERITRLTFSQREGIAPLPEAMRLKQVTADFINLVWFIVDTAITEQQLNERLYKHDAPISSIIRSYFLRVHKYPHDEIEYSPSQHRGYLRKTILEGDYHEVLTLVEFIVSRKRCPEYLRRALESAFQEGRLAYTIRTIDGRSTIVPRVSEESNSAIQSAIQNIEEKGPVGAKTHLRAATNAINEERYADAVRECIHAVESVARTIDPKAGKTLHPALSSLERAGVLNHRALKDAFNKLYGYTNDESGIRHALLESSTANVDQEDAVFMFGACACFAAYLTNKNENIAK